MVKVILDNLITGNFNVSTILQYDKKGNFIKEWNNIKEASINLRIIRTSIDNNLNNRSNRSNSSGGFIFKYKDTK